METKIISIICYILALIIAVAGMIMSAMKIEELANIFIFLPIILIAIGSLLPLLLKE